MLGITIFFVFTSLNSNAANINSAPWTIDIPSVTATTMTCGQGTVPIPISSSCAQADSIAMSLLVGPLSSCTQPCPPGMSLINTTSTCTSPNAKVPEYVVTISGTCTKLQLPPVIKNSQSPQIYAGNGVTCGTDTNGALYCWGLNNYGQLGIGNTSNTATPTAVPSLNSNISLASNGGDTFSTCAIQYGNLYCSGLSNLASSLNQSLPLPFPVLSTGAVTNVALTGNSMASNIGNFSTTSGCAISAGAVYCWGDNSVGQMGIGNLNYGSSPTIIPALSSNTTAIAGGEISLFFCAIQSGGVSCWGNTPLGHSSVPIPVPNLSSGVTAVSAGNDFACALKSGAVYCWGDNSVGQLGNGSTIAASVPTLVPGMNFGVTAITTGETYACGIKNGVELCWGDNLQGQLGNSGTAHVYTSPTVVYGTGSGGVTSISGGDNHNCNIMNGFPYCWGDNSNLELGPSAGTSIKSYVPVPVTI